MPFLPIYCENRPLVVKPMIKFKTLLFALLIVPFVSSAQNDYTCGTDEYMQKQMADHAEIKEAYHTYLDELSKLPMTPSDHQQNKKKTVRTIPVVFHIIHMYGEENISKDRVLEQIDILNKDFRHLNDDKDNIRAVFADRAADCEVEFALATIDPDGNCTDGITRTYSTMTDVPADGDAALKSVIRWDTRKYLNIWVVRNLAKDGGGVLGYATLPYSKQEATDGVVMLAEEIGYQLTGRSTGGYGRTLTHEVGHYLGLLHTFQGGCGNSCSTSGDRVCDTPPVSEANRGCPTTANTCSNDNPDEPDMIENYMDYTRGNCQVAYTEGQKSVITYALNNYRQILWSSTNLAETGAGASTTCTPVADFQVTDQIQRICAGSKVTLKDLSWNAEVVDYEWTIEGGNPNFTTLKDPEVTFNTPGRYEITLKVSNGAGNNSVTKKNIIQVVPTTAQFSTPFSEDFENETEFGKDWIRLDGRSGWRYSSVSYDGSGGLEATITQETPDGMDYYIEFPPVNMSQFGGSDAVLSFRSAYALPVSGSNGEYMYLEASTDCGETWKNVSVWLGRLTLKSTTTTGYNWKPASKSDWQVLYADLNKNNYTSTENLFLRFRVRSSSGNSVYIDDILIDRYGLSTNDIDPRNGLLSIHPNPNSGNFVVEIHDANNAERIEIMDHTGRIVKTIETNGSENAVSVEDLASGIYYVRVQWQDGATASRKVIVANNNQ